MFDMSTKRTFSYAVDKLKPLGVMEKLAEGGADPGYTGVFWDYDDLPIAGSFNPFDVHLNIKASLAKKNLCGFFELSFYCDKELPVPDYLVQSYRKARLCFVPDVSKSLRAKIMIRDILLYAWDNNPCFNDGQPANLVIVSNTISQDPDMISVLQALNQRNFSVLLVRSDELKHKAVDPGDIATENLDWLWQSIMFGDKTFIDPSETRAGSLFCSGCHAEVSITENGDGDGDGEQTEDAVVKL
ncbi:hypothetical protein Bca4012_047347 [Brassica carinata]